MSKSIKKITIEEIIDDIKKEKFEQCNPFDPIYTILVDVEKKIKIIEKKIIDFQFLTRT